MGRGRQPLPIPFSQSPGSIGASRGHPEWVPPINTKRRVTTRLKKSDTAVMRYLYFSFFSGILVMFVGRLAAAWLRTLKEDANGRWVHRPLYGDNRTNHAAAVAHGLRLLLILFSTLVWLAGVIDGR